MNIYYLTKAQHETLLSSGTVTLTDGTVVTYSTGDVYAVPDADVPIPTTGDAGKVLKVNSNGVYELVTLYRHNITIDSVNGYSVYFTIYNYDSTLFTSDTIQTYILANGNVSCSGLDTDEGVAIYMIKYIDQDSRYYIMKASGSSAVMTFDNVEDTVIAVTE